LSLPPCSAVTPRAERDFCVAVMSSPVDARGHDGWPGRRRSDGLKVPGFGEEQ
jgi:hypothetical protein